MGEAATIDTAPRDGTHILGKDGFWREMWLVRDQYEGEFWRDEFDSEPEPTHWAPLPAPSPRSDENQIFIHTTPKCEHEFAGWREFEDGNGGEQVCTKCGIGAMSASLRDGP